MTKHNKKPLLFIHIPKTAGSSFREALEEYYDSNDTYLDYGADSPLTHAKIKNVEYELQDRFMFNELFLENHLFVAGHFPYNRYAPFYKSVNTISFLREPAQQIRSHFEHHVRHLGYSKSFSLFIKERRFTNLQSRNLHGIPLAAIGFIGITERYSESIDLINQLQGLNLKILTNNQNRDKPKDKYEFSDEEINLIKERNQNDYRLYENAQFLFNLASSQVNRSIPLIKGACEAVPPRVITKRVSGWITVLKSDRIQQAVININGEERVRLQANKYRGWAKERNVNRQGFIGFDYFPDTPLVSGDLIELFSVDGDLLDKYEIKD